MSDPRTLAATAEAFATFHLGYGERATPDAVATAFTSHLAGLDVRKLPPEAAQVWEHILTKLLKVPAGTWPLPARAVAGIASWPQARITQLIDAIRAIEAEVTREINDRLADETNERVSRAYL